MSFLEHTQFAQSHSKIIYKTNYNKKITNNKIS